MNSTKICIDYSNNEKMFNDISFSIKVNFEECHFTSFFITFFTENKNFNILKSALEEKRNIEINLIQNGEIVRNNIYSPISILIAIKSRNELLDVDTNREVKYLLNKYNFKNFVSKNKDKYIEINIDNKVKKIPISLIFDLLSNEKIYNEFNSRGCKYCDFFKEELIFALKSYFSSKKIFLSYELDKVLLINYENLIKKYDTEAYNKYLSSDFKYSKNIKININFYEKIISLLPKKSSLIEKTIYIYLNLYKYLKYEYEFDNSNTVKKHKDLSRIEEIDINNNSVFSYEFSCLLAKFFESLDLKITYTDKKITTRIGNYLLKFNSINNKFNYSVCDEIEALKGIFLINSNYNTNKNFEKIINKIKRKIYQNLFIEDLKKMSFNQQLNFYCFVENFEQISFNEKYHIFLELIDNPKINYNSIAYIFELKKILFNKYELNSNISFAVVKEIKDNSYIPVVIITTNSININLYNSNEYVYFNPPNKIEKFNLKELRLNFFYSRFKYINKKDNIIGVERNNYVK